MIGVNQAYALEKPNDHTSLTVCIGDRFDFQGYSDPRYVKEAKIGIDEWIVHLKEKESKNDKWVWDANVKIIPWYQYYDKDCMVGVEFFYKPDNVETISDVVGEFWTEKNGFSRINIYYGDIGYDVSSWSDGHYDYTKYTPVYKGNMGSAQVANIARHEFGHFLGLNHTIATGGNSIISNSIMNPIININPKEEQIRTIDVDSVKKLYPHGFNDATWNSRGLKTAGESGIYPPTVVYVYDTVDDKNCKFSFCLIPKNIELASKGELRISTVYGQSTSKYVIKDQNNSIVFSDIIVEPGQYTSVYFKNDGVFTLIENTYGESANQETSQITVGKKIDITPTKILSEKEVSDAKKLDSMKLAEKKLADAKKLADKKLADKKLADKKLADKKLADKKLADKKLADAKKTKMAEEKAKK